MGQALRHVDIVLLLKRHDSQRRLDTARPPVNKCQFVAVGIGHQRWLAFSRGTQPHSDIRVGKEQLTSQQRAATPTFPGTQVVTASQWFQTDALRPTGMSPEVLLQLYPMRRPAMPEDGVDRFETCTGEAMLVGKLAIDLKNCVGLLREFAPCEPMDHPAPPFLDFGFPPAGTTGRSLG